VRALDLAASVPWAIRPEALEAILTIAAREDIPQDVVARLMTSGSTEAVAAKLGKPLDNTRSVTVRDGVAIIPIAGPIFRHANLFSEISGATTTEAVAQDLATALATPAVRAILLEVDSPGGEVAGISELAAMIRAATAEKPVTAYIDDLGASAAYWLASAAGSIVAAPTAVLGSLGVVAVMRDPSKTKSTDLEFVSSQSPNKRPDLTTEAGKAQVQATVDALADVFVADVARYRGTSVETVLSDFGQGGVFVGQQAVDAGMADAIGSHEQTLRDLAEQTAPVDTAPAAARPAGPGRKAAMGMRDKFFAWLDGLDASGSADQEAAIVSGNLDTQPSPAIVATRVESNDETEMRRLRAELTAARAESDRLRVERIQAEALGFVTQAIAGEKAFPVEREAIVALYVQAALDDVKMADGANRVALLAAIYTARPASALTREQLNPTAIQIMRQTESTLPKGEEKPDATEKARLIGMTSFGQAHLDAKNGASKN
jgi:signal peptide peptidase SppA